MAQCITEIKEVEAEAAQTGKAPKFSRNQISKKHGLSPSIVRLEELEGEESFKQVSFSSDTVPINYPA